MAPIEAKTVQVYPCDGCGRDVIAPSSGGKPKGFFGEVTEVHPDYPGGSKTISFYAHLDRCIKQAVLNCLG